MLGLIGGSLLMFLSLCCSCSDAYGGGSGPATLLAVPGIASEASLGIYAAWKGSRTSVQLARTEDGDDWLSRARPDCGSGGSRSSSPDSPPGVGASPAPTHQRRPADDHGERGARCPPLADGDVNGGRPARQRTASRQIPKWSTMEPAGGEAHPRVGDGGPGGGVPHEAIDAAGSTSWPPARSTSTSSRRRRGRRKAWVVEP